MKAVLLSALAVAAFGSERFTWEESWKQRTISDWHNVDHKAAFRAWQNEFGRDYANTDEEARKFITFLDNWRRINEFNLEGGRSYWLGVNQFADMTEEEFRLYVHGHGGSCIQDRPAWKKVEDAKNEEAAVDVASCSSVDWVSKGKVTPVKNQGSCGSCWAFSAVGCTESRYAIAHGTLTSLSEQELVDCSSSEGNAGCNGGWMDSAFKYIQGAGGLAKDSDYTYTARDGTCKASSYSHVDPITGYKDVSADSSTSLANAVCDGPVSVAIEADQFSFQYYSGGILDGSCGTSLDHGVLVVGFGTDGSESYWKVKNSWGTSWGESGYVRICKDCNKNGNEGECGILEAPSYVTA
jgi:hypothetical protein